jgi:class 3 adenylate cyclase
MPATILFSDIVGFTRTVEALEGNLEALKGHLSSALDAVAEVHRKHDLIIDKFIGDAVMSFRGGDLVEGSPSEHAYRVVRAAIESVTALEKLNDPYFNKIKIGGASAECALIGAFGTSTRLTYTVLGDRVNLAARLEASVAQCKVSNLFCERTFELTKERKDILWRRFGQLKVAGKKETISVYEAFDPSAHENIEWLTTYRHGLDNFESQDFVNAKRSFEQTNDTRPGGDAPSMLFAERCDQLMNVDLPEDWQPVIETSK